MKKFAVVYKGVVIGTDLSPQEAVQLLYRSASTRISPFGSTLSSNITHHTVQMKEPTEQGYTLIPNSNFYSYKVRTCMTSDPVEYFRVCSLNAKSVGEAGSLCGVRNDKVQLMIRHTTSDNGRVYYKRTGWLSRSSVYSLGHFPTILSRSSFIHIPVEQYITKLEHLANGGDTSEYNPPPLNLEGILPERDITLSDRPPN